MSCSLPTNKSLLMWRNKYILKLKWLFSQHICWKTLYPRFLHSRTDLTAFVMLITLEFMYICLIRFRFELQKSLEKLRRHIINNVTFSWAFYWLRRRYDYSSEKPLDKMLLWRRTTTPRRPPIGCWITRLKWAWIILACLIRSERLDSVCFSFTAQVLHKMSNGSLWNRST